MQGYGRRGRDLELHFQDRLLTFSDLEDSGNTSQGCARRAHSHDGGGERNACAEVVCHGCLHCEHRRDVGDREKHRYTRCWRARPRPGTSPLESASRPLPGTRNERTAVKVVLVARTAETNRARGIRRQGQDLDIHLLGVPPRRLPSTKIIVERSWTTRACRIKVVIFANTV